MTWRLLDENSGSDSGAEFVMVCLVLLTLVCIYLLFANIVFVFRVNEHLPPGCRSDSVGKKFWLTQEISRLLYAFTMVVFDFWILWQNRVEDGWIEENLSAYPCKETYRWAEIFYTNGITTFIRLVYAFARCVLMKRSLSQKTRVAPFVIILTLLLGLTGLNQWFMEYKVVAGVCVYEITSPLRVTWVMLIIGFESTSFWLYYKPLRDADIQSGLQIYVYSKFRRQNSNNRRSDYFGMYASEALINATPEPRISRDSLGYEKRRSRNRVSRTKTLMVQSFHRSVVRNFYAGLVCIIASIAWNVVYFFLDENVWYWRSGFGYLYFSLTSLTIYVSLTAGIKEWRLALCPFTYCKNYTRARESLQVDQNSLHGDLPDISILEGSGYDAHLSNSYERHSGEECVGHYEGVRNIALRQVSLSEPRPHLHSQEDVAVSLIRHSAKS